MNRKPIICMTTATDTAPDSLTRLVTYRNYAHAFIDQGAIVLCVCDADPDSARQLCEVCDGLFLTGGVDVSPSLYHTEIQSYCGATDPWRDQVESVYIKTFLQAGKPIFGICRGFQMLNVMLGGSLYQDIPSEMGLQHTYNSVHSVTLSGGSVLDTLFGSCICVNSFHHQAIRTLAPDLIPLAFSEDGAIVEAFHHTVLPILAVQWHPERMTGEERMTPEGPDMAPLFHHFISLCTKKESTFL
ncbi:gamma-glutamyl-gamma-aminobutyrate hydrolase family protein [Flintibacter muris]|uniref:gamma-glutamyl-gamma-aminobutyrate hydrolase family protein n=1 Tax=Flintibacter muris TaxID=2941327 RepID=UPI00203E7DA4|nr:type 1 glutamine amidotransferase [Flintibacter muris]